MHAPAARDEDPCPALPDTFRQVAHVVKIAEQVAFGLENHARYRGPERLLRTCLSSLVSSHEFGPLMHAEAARWLFFAAVLAWETNDAARWQRHLAWTEAVWQGRVQEVITEWAAELTARGARARTR